jgi:hypothetical protein
MNEVLNTSLGDIATDIISKLTDDKVEQISITNNLVDQYNKAKNIPLANINAETERHVSESHVVGGVREVKTLKGHPYLMPFDVLALVLNDIISCKDFKEDYSFDNMMKSIVNLFYAKNSFLKNPTTENAINIQTSFHKFLSIYNRKPLSRTFFESTIDYAIHLEKSLAKYAIRNWEKGLDWSCYIDSFYRHFIGFILNDEEEPHLPSVIWNGYALIYSTIHNPEFNNIGQTIEEIPEDEENKILLHPIDENQITMDELIREPI